MLETGEIVCVDLVRAQSVAVPGPPPPDRPIEQQWTPATVQRVRADGWVIVRLHRRTAAHDLNLFVAPSEAVRPPASDGRCD